MKKEVAKFQKNIIVSDGSGAQLFAVTLKPKEVVDLCSVSVEEQLQWDYASCKEVKALIENGVAQLVPVQEYFDALANKGRDSVQLLPSLAITTVKPDGRRKVRVVACGNFERETSESNYASTVEFSFWRQCLNMTVQGRGSIGCLDVCEAFGQSDPSPHDPVMYLRLPSQWKERFLFPSILTELSAKIDPHKQLTPKTLADWALKILKSTYGLKRAPRVWKTTLSSALATLGFQPSKYDDSVYFHVGTGQVVCVWVDDVWCFGCRGEDVKATLDKLQERFKCTPIQWLCYAGNSETENLGSNTKSTIFLPGTAGRCIREHRETGIMTRRLRRASALTIATSPLRQTYSYTCLKKRM